MDIIMRANKKHFNEEVDNVCEALGELVRERYAGEIAEAALNANKKLNPLLIPNTSRSFLRNLTCKKTILY